MKLHLVPARTGVEWVRQGIKVYWRQPLALTLLFFMITTAMSLLSAIPLAGPVIALALLPTATLLMMEAAAETHLGRVPTPALLAGALRTGRQRLPALLTLGAIYAILFLLIIGVSALLDGGQFARLYFGSEPMTADVARNGEFMGAMWVVMLLYVPLSMLFWHAPGLVHWHNVPPAKALFFSIVACFRNIAAFTLFSAVWFGVFMAGGVVVSIVLALLTLMGMPAGVVAALMIATALVLATMFFCSIVFTFRDNYEAPRRGDSNDELLIG